MEIEKDDIPFTSVVLVEFNVLQSPPVEVSGLHVIFDLNYLFSTILPYLVLFGSSRSNVQTYVRRNPFKNIKSISCSDLDYKMLFETCSDRCEMTLYKGKTKKIVIYLLFFKV